MVEERQEDNDESLRRKETKTGRERGEFGEEHATEREIGTRNDERERERERERNEE